MKLEEYKSIYEKMETSKEMDQRILNSVQNNKKTKKIAFVKAASVAAVFALVVGVYQIPTVNGAVNDFISKPSLESKSVLTLLAVVEIPLL